MTKLVGDACRQYTRADKKMPGSERNKPDTKLGLVTGALKLLLP